MRLLWGQEEAVSSYLSAKFPELCAIRPYVPHVAVAFIDDAGRLRGGLGMRMLNAFDGELSISVDHPVYFPNKGQLRLMFRRTFLSAGVSRLTCKIAKRNHTARKVVEGLGFTLEGALKKGFDGHRTAMIYGMTSDNCPWLKDDTDAVPRGTRSV